jgi:hypothetical protein
MYLLSLDSVLSAATKQTYVTNKSQTIALIVDLRCNQEETARVKAVYFQGNVYVKGYHC